MPSLELKGAVEVLAGARTVPFGMPRPAFPKEGLSSPFGAAGNLYVLQALMEVLSNHKYLWNDARTSATLSKMEQNLQQLANNPDQVRDEGVPPPPPNPFKRLRGGKKKKRLQTPSKDEEAKKIVKEDPTKKPMRDNRIPEKEWKLTADAAKKVQGARRCHYFNSSLGRG